jgi:hypothetical protein
MTEQTAESGKGAKFTAGNPANFNQFSLWEKWQPVGESNPSFQVENLTS